MKTFWAKTNLYILTLAGVITAIVIIALWKSMPAGQKALGFFCIGMVLHEWEETRFPGGFFTLMAKKFKIRGITDMQWGLAHGVVVTCIVFFAFLPFLFWEQVPWLAGIPALLGLFEAFIHFVGIWIHHMPHFYTPGLATSLFWLLPNAICIIIFAMPGVTAAGWLAAAVCFVLIFLAMEMGILRVLRIKPKEVLRNAFGH